jgi:hypothetical protein
MHVETAAPAAPVAPPEVLQDLPAVAAEPPMNFHNPVAVRVAFAMALTGAFLAFLLLPGSLVWWPGSGYFAVYLYRRRTGFRLSVRHGVRMGWMTGVLLFGVFTVLFTASTVPLLVSGEFARQLQEQVRRTPFPGADPNQVVQMMQNPASVGMMLVMLLLFFFAFIVSLCTAGGALGAKMAGRR